MANFIAHTAPEGGQVQSIHDHLTEVARLAGEFALPLDLSDEAALAGLLHDCGKYGDHFQRRLLGQERHIDHWSQGAYLALKHMALAAALSIYGHHVGLQEFSQGFFRRLNRIGEDQPMEDGRRLAGSLEQVVSRFTEEGLVATRPARPLIARYPQPSSAVEFMMGVRNLYSCLVDADYLDTEAHFQQDAEGHKQFRAKAPDLRPDVAFSLLARAIEAKSTTVKTSAEVKHARQSVWQQAIEAGRQPHGLWTLTAPTGSGKTLAMLGFALRHAAVHQKRRIIVALPYLNIIEQTVAAYREVLGEMGDGYILEHHSLSDRQGVDGWGTTRLAADNWDAPIVVTTTVQLFESLFSNRPGRSRKLHRLADAVILLDEVQTIPLPVVVPTVAALAALPEVSHATIVLGTATQPAFESLREAAMKVTDVPYEAKEVMREPIPSLSRVTAEFRDTPQRWEELANELIELQESFMAIVNLKAHAVAMTESLLQVGGDPLHVSTNMCPSHRASVIAQVKDRLGRGIRTLLVATQCVEAGVDLDFPTVYRAWGPVDALAQASGRCNRAGLQDHGRFVVFLPDETTLYPPGVYRQASQLALSLWREQGRILDLEDPGTFNRYWQRLYSSNRPHETYHELMDAIRRFDFVETAERYRLIEGPITQVLVPWAPRLAEFDALVWEARNRGISQDWVRRAQPLSIGIYMPSGEARSRFEQVGDSGWWICRYQEDYTKRFGLQAPNEWNILLA
jgi:CRISPR-associated endonuclease/helicase Cas3